MFQDLLVLSKLHCESEQLGGEGRDIRTFSGTPDPSHQRIVAAAFLKSQATYVFASAVATHSSGTFNPAKAECWQDDGRGLQLYIPPLWVPQVSSSRDLEFRIGIASPFHDAAGAPSHLDEPEQDARTHLVEFFSPLLR